MPGTRRPPSDAAFTEFVHAVWPRLYRLAYLLVGDRGLAEDLVQTALVQTYASWSRVRDLDAAPGYARATLVNTAQSWFRRRSWRDERTTAYPPDRWVEEDLTDRSTLMAALAELAPRQRAVVVLRFYEDQSVAQTAQILGCAEGTVKSQTADALRLLRERLGDTFARPHTSDPATRSHR